MLINIYQRHIDRGFRGKGSELLCPIAVAMTEQLGTKIGIWDGKAFIMQTGDYYELPEQAVKSYLRYDRTGLMKAFSFDIGKLKPREEKKKEEVKAVTA
jgi:hypothetical protein